MKVLLARFYKAPEDIIYQALVFLVVFIAAKFGQYLYFDWYTSPAILWPPTGIILAIIYIGGYRYVPVIFTALFLTSISGPFGFIWPWTIIITLGQVVSGMVGVYLLRRYNNDSHQTNLINVVHFLITIVVVSMIVPTMTTLVGPIMGTFSETFYVSWSRAWVGYVFSCLILFPLIITWFPYTSIKIYSFYRLFEWSVVALLSVLSVNIIFWTHDQNEWRFFSQVSSVDPVT